MVIRLSTWIKAEAAAAELDYPTSVQLFRSLDTKVCTQHTVY